MVTVHPLSQRRLPGGSCIDGAPYPLPKKLFLFALVKGFRRIYMQLCNPNCGFAPERTMAYIVTESCIKCKLMDCVVVCPVDCFYEGENMLVIHPDECINCGDCETECLVEAIVPDTEFDIEKFVKINAEYSNKWPNINRKGETADDADAWREKTGKIKYFSPKPGQSG